MRQGDVLAAVRELGPCTTLDVVHRICGDVPEWRIANLRTNTYNALRCCERYGEITHTVEEGIAVWRCVP